MNLEDYDCFPLTSNAVYYYNTLPRSDVGNFNFDGLSLGSFTLAQPMDAAWVDDSRRFHGVTPVEPRDPSRPAFRDVLVVTFRREDAV